MAGLNIPSLKIDILADGTQAIREIKNVRDAAVEMINVGATMTKTTTVPIVTILAAATKVAGNYAETLSKTDVVFGNMTDAVMKWSESSVDAMGMAQSTALEMAAKYGDMATGMGLAGAEAANMSMNITQLAADISSFKNKSLSEVNTALTGIFTGETESLKQLGIIMTQTNLQAFAMEQGITKSIQSMSQAEQVQLRYNYVMAQSANAQGDFMRTGNSLNNQSRKLTETIKQLGDEFGSVLTDKAAKAMGGLQSAAQWFLELSDGTKQMIVDIGMLVAAAGPLLLVGGKAIGMLSTLKTTIAAFAPSPVILAVNTLLASFAALYAISRDNRKEIDRSSDDFKRLKGIVSGGASGKVSIDDTEVQNLLNHPPSVTINAKAEFEQESSSEADLQAFIESIEKLPRGETYYATGEFKTTDATTETIQEYAEAMTAAATATEDYASAVETLNNIVDQEAERKASEIFTGFTEYAKQQTALANEGYISVMQAETNILAAYADMEEQLRIIRKETELQKEINQKFDNGLKSDDSETLVDTLMGMYENEKVSEQTVTDSGYKLIDAIRSGRPETAQMEAQIMLDDTRKEAIADQQAFTAAIEQYNKTLEQANINEQAALETRQKEGEMYAFLLDMIGTYYSTIQTGESAERAMLGVMSDYADEFERYAGTADIFKNLLTGLDGEIMGGKQLKQLQAVFDSVEAMQTDAESRQTQIIEEAAAAREKAVTGLLADLETIGEGYTASEASGLFNAAEQTGLVISEEDKRSIRETAQIITDLANAINEGQGDLGSVIEKAVGDMEAVSLGGDIAAGIGQGEREYDFAADAEAMTANNENAIRDAAQSNSPARRFVPVGEDIAAGVGLGMSNHDFGGEADGMAANIGAAAKAAVGNTGGEIGKRITQGIAQGIRNGTGEAMAAARASARAITNAYKTELDIHSPSRKMRDEVGLQIARGIGEGINIGMPDVLKSIRQNIAEIDAGTIPVLNNGAYTVPIAPYAITYGGGIDYDRLGEAVGKATDYERLADAVSRRPISFNVDSRELATATRDETARQQALRVRQVNAGYGNIGG